MQAVQGLSILFRARILRLKQKFRRDFFNHSRHLVEETTSVESRENDHPWVIFLINFRANRPVCKDLLTAAAATPVAWDFGGKVLLLGDTAPEQLHCYRESVMGRLSSERCLPPGNRSS